MLKQAGIVAGLTGLAMSAGCSYNWGSARFTSRELVTLNETQVAGARSVLIQTAAGDVILEETSGPSTIEAHIRAQTQERADETTVAGALGDDGRLEISVVWPDGKRRENEGCDLHVRVPQMNGVRIRSNAGDIEVSGMMGEMLIETSAGDVDVNRHGGKVTVITSAGDIEIRDVSGAVSAKTSAGDIDLVRVSTPVTARTSAGDIHASMIGPYTGTIVADTSVGGLHVLGKQYKQKHLTLSMGEGPQISRFESSVGDVRVTVTDN